MLSLLEIEKLIILINQLVTISKFLVHEKVSGTSPNLSQLPNSNIISDHINKVTIEKNRAILLKSKTKI
jgi:hypothetical protein